MSMVACRREKRSRHTGNTHDYLATASGGEGEEEILELGEEEGRIL